MALVGRNGMVPQEIVGFLCDPDVFWEVIGFQSDCGVYRVSPLKGDLYTGKPTLWSTRGGLEQIAVVVP